ncbi:MAG: thioesterase II family protein [Chloroflexi bacterium]|nr:thioesterase II family protein [Chloroflexota bacterium]
MQMNTWLAYDKPDPQASLRLFCLPYAGGNASIFSAWHTDLPSYVEVCPVELPGRGRRLNQPLYTSIGPLVHAMTEALSPLLDKPFALFGHSLGALVSFELARHLRAIGGPCPVCLFVSGHSAPQTPEVEAPIHHLPEAEFVEKVRSLNGTPDEVFQNAELKELILPILRADFAISETFVYRAGPPLDCPISVYGSLQDASISRARLEAWGEQTTDAFTLHMLPGDHFFINTARSFLLQSLAHELDHLVKRHSPGCGRPAFTKALPHLDRRLEWVE